jgi:hypothetical protein
MLEEGRVGLHKQAKVLRDMRVRKFKEGTVRVRSWFMGDIKVNTINIKDSYLLREATPILVGNSNIIKHPPLNKL